MRIEETASYHYLLPPEGREGLRKLIIVGEGRMLVYQGILRGNDLTSAEDYYHTHMNIFIDHFGRLSDPVEDEGRLKQIFETEVTIARSYLNGGILKDHMASIHIENVTNKVLMNKERLKKVSHARH